MTIAAWSTRAATARCSIAMPGPTWRALPRHGTAGARRAKRWPRRAARSSRRKADQDLLLAHLAELTRYRTAGGRGGERSPAPAPTCRRARSWRATSKTCARCGTVRIRRSPRLRVAARRLDRIAAGTSAAGRGAGRARPRGDRGGRGGGEAASRGRGAAPRSAELDRIETRLFELRALARKHRCEVDELPEVMRDHARSSSMRSRAGDADIADLREGRTRGARGLSRTGRGAACQPRVRRDAARRGGGGRTCAAQARCRALPDRGGRAAGGALGPARAWTRSNSSSPPTPAPISRRSTKIASGGELSRFILALKVALAEQGGAATVIFDEIDRGVGGAVASAIGERLARLAGRRAVAGGDAQPASRRARQHALHDRQIERGHGDEHLGRICSTMPGGRKKSRACCRARKSPARRARRRIGCWRVFDETDFPDWRCDDWRWARALRPTATWGRPITCRRLPRRKTTPRLGHAGACAGPVFRHPTFLIRPPSAPAGMTGARKRRCRRMRKLR